MYLLYLDDSGSVRNAADSHIILAGLAVFERQPFWFSNEMDTLAQEIWPTDPFELEFHGTDMFSGNKKWRKIKKEIRYEVYNKALNVLSRSNKAVLFGAAIHKQAISPEDPMEFAFEQIVSRFDKFLTRLYKNNNTQRGIIILDESSHETSLQRLSHEFRRSGHRWGRTHNISEVPLFVDSKATRMIQYADLVAYAIRHYYQHGTSAYIDTISNLFDSEGGSLHGLIHYTPSDTKCNCIACRHK
jgi:hypothetical protein